MPDHPDHGADEIDPIPGRNKNMHTPQFNDPINPFFSSQQGQFLLFLRIGHA